MKKYPLTGAVNPAIAIPIKVQSTKDKHFQVKTFKYFIEKIIICVIIPTRHKIQIGVIKLLIKVMLLKMYLNK